MSDLSQQLRNASGQNGQGELLLKAADEMDRLEKLLEIYQEELTNISDRVDDAMHILSEAEEGLVD